MKDPLAYQVFAILISRFIYQNFNEQEQIYLGQYWKIFDIFFSATQITHPPLR